MANDSTRATPEEVGKEYISYCRRLFLEEYLPRMRRCVEQLPPDDVWWRAHETDNSVANLILHLCGNVRQWIVVGIGAARDNRDRAREFGERRHIPKEELLGLLESTLKEADGALARFDPGLLLEVRHIQQYDVTCLYAISHVVEHFSQHLGQIIYITKLRTGTDLKFYDL